MRLYNILTICFIAALLAACSSTKQTLPIKKVPISVQGKLPVISTSATGKSVQQNIPQMPYTIPDRVFWDSGTNYYRIDYQWYLRNIGSNSPLYNLGSLASTEPGGTVDMNYTPFTNSIATNLFALVDSGVMTNHPAFAHLTFSGYNFATRSGQPANNLSDLTGHGTKTLGVIAAHTVDGYGVYGMLQGLNTIVIAKSLLSDPVEVANAINYCVNVGSKIICLPYGTSINSTELRTSIDRAGVSNVIVVCAAPNSPNDLNVTADYPSCWKQTNVISVNNIDRTGGLYWSGFSSNHVHLGAPGRVIVTTGVSTPYLYTSGTSLATPMVAATLCAIKTMYPLQPNSVIIDRLRKTATYTDSLNGKTVFNGRLNFGAAVDTIPIMHISQQDSQISLFVEGCNHFDLESTTDFYNWQTVAKNLPGLSEISIDSTFTFLFLRAHKID